MTGAAPDRRQDQLAGRCADDGGPYAACHWTCQGRCAPELTPEEVKRAIAEARAAVSPVPGQQREAVARWLEREYVGLIDDESWQGCLDAADELLALLAATQDGGQA